MRRLLAAGLCALAAPAAAFDPPPDGAIRVASFNIDLARERSGQLIGELAACGLEKARRGAEILQIVRPDLVLLNEFDWDEDGDALRRFQTECLDIGWNSAAPIAYTTRFAGPVNAGVDSGADLDRDGRRGEREDAWGYGAFPGQYGMALLARFPIAATRSFQTLPWLARPDMRPPLREDGSIWFDADVAAAHPLSSKSHWDIALETPLGRLHALASHPTPPIGEGRERRNSRRNADEIGFWVDYLTPGKSGWIVDDAGGRGGLADAAAFVILGDLNADPADGRSFKPPIRALVDHPALRDPRPRSAGAVADAAENGGPNARHRADPAFDTADFEGPGNLRVDYVLPSRRLRVVGAGVFWPAPGDPLRRLIEGGRDAVSDHRLVWVDLAR